MTPELAVSVIETLIKDMTPSQKFEVLGRLAANVALAGVGNPSAVHNPAPTPVSAPPSPAPTASGKVMIPAGFLCECDNCNRPIYKIGTDVLENMPKKDFVAAFVPMGADVPELKMPLDTWADHGGNLAIDCPVCKGTKSLWIKGKGDVKFNDIPQGDNGGRSN